MRTCLGWVVALALVLAGCSSIPRDPEGSLDRVRETGVLRVAASPSEGRVTVDGEQVTGPEPELITAFAESLGAEPQWHVMGEESAVEAMDRGEIDVLIGGLTDQTTWAPKIGMTRPYAETVEHGKTVKHVMAVPMGENALLAALERHLDEAAP